MAVVTDSSGGERPEADNQIMLEKFLNIFRIPDLRKRVLFTLGILAVYRLGAYIPTPGVNTTPAGAAVQLSRAARRWA